MASLYARGKKLWFRLKEEGRWVSKPTPFRVGEEVSAQRYADAAQKLLANKVAAAGATGPHTVRSFSRVWLKERRERGVRSVDKEESRIRRHLLPRIGSKRLDEV